MKMNAIKHQGKNTSDTGSPKLSSEIVGKIYGDGSTNVKKYMVHILYVKIWRILLEQLIHKNYLNPKKYCL